MEQQVMQGIIYFAISILISGFVGYMIARMMKKVLMWIATILAVVVIAIIGLSYLNIDVSNHAIDITSDVTNRTAMVMTNILTSYANHYAGQAAGIMAAGVGSFIVGFYFGIRSK